MTDNAGVAATVRKLAQLAFALGVIATIYVSVAPRSGMPQVDVWDKFAHGAMYFSLSIAALIGFRRGLRAAWICAGVCLLGVALELLQATLPYRTGSFDDVIANAAGIALAAAVIVLLDYFLSTLYRRRRNLG